MNLRNNELDTSIWYSTLLKPENYKVSYHFFLREFASHDGEHGVLVHNELLLGLEALRNHFNAVVMINSGYRSTRHNEIVGGVRMSKHLFGLAADIDVLGIHPDIVAEYAGITLDFGGVGRYNTFTHVDVFGEDRRWDSRTPRV